MTSPPQLRQRAHEILCQIRTEPRCYFPVRRGSSETMQRVSSKSRLGLDRLETGVVSAVATKTLATKRNRETV